MTKRTIWYVCLSVLCCSALALMVNAAAMDAEKETMKKQLAPGTSNREADVQVQTEKEQSAGMVTEALEPESSPTSTTDPAFAREWAVYQRWLATGTASAQDKALLEESIFPLLEERSDPSPLDSTGGPSGGYCFVDNSQGDTATYAWSELRNDGGAVHLLGSAFSSPDDGSTAVIPLPFTFTFYGTGYTGLRIMTNGSTQFVTNSTTFSNTCTLPATAAGAAIFPFWDDLHIARNGSTNGDNKVHYKAEADRFIIEWDSIGYFSPSTGVAISMQVLLYTNGKVKVQYKDLTGATNSATVGIQNAPCPASALVYTCNATRQLAANRAVWYYVCGELPQPFGRCCYGDLYAPTCVDTTRARCVELCGAFTCAPTSCSANPCTIPCTNLACPAGSVQEGEPWCGVAPTPDTDNGGCNSTPSVFDTLECGQTVCGTTAALGGTRDTDWYMITVASPQIISWTARGPFAILLGTLNSPCPQTLFRRSATGASCVQTTVVDTFQAAGTYYLFVAQNSFADLAQSPYVATVTCTPFVPPVGRCCYGDPDAPSCADNTLLQCTSLSGRWVDSLTCATPCPPCTDFTINAPGSIGPVSTCGAGDDCPLRVGQDYQIRVVIPHDGLWNLGFCLPDNQAWDSYAYLTTACCGGTVIATNDDGCQDNVESFDDPLFACLPLAAGSYFLDFEPFSSAVCSLMSFSVTEIPPCIVTCQSGDIVEGAEPCDSTHAATDPNGGCNNDDNGGVNSWGTIQCGQTVCGNLFTYVGPGGANFRDTDWYHLTVADSESLYVHIETERGTLFGVINDNACTSPALLVSSTTTCGQCTSFVWSQCLPAGTYSIYAAPSVFSGLPCPPFQYRMTVQCIPCGTVCEPPTQLTVLRDDSLADRVNLRWNATQTFGVYLVFGTTVKNNDGDPNHGADPNWTLLGSVPAPAVPGQLAFTDSPLVPYMNYVVEHDCRQYGRCCYGDPQNPSCATNVVEDCASLGGTWTPGLNCVDNPCSVPPVNDDCANAITVTAGVEVTGDNTLATGTDISSCAFNDDQDVWYVYTPAASATATFSLCNASGVTLNDPTLSLFDECGGAQLACDDDSCPADLRSTFTFAVTVGEDYFIRVAGYSSTEGTFHLLVTQ